MKLIYKHKHEGLFFSHRGHKAYLRGEKPKELWPIGFVIEQTEAHHIGRSTGDWYGGYTRELVMFYIALTTAGVPIILKVKEGK